MTLLTQLAVRHMEDGRGLIVLDADGDLVDALLGLVPKDRVGEVIYVDLGNTERVIGLNPIEIKVGAGISWDPIIANVLGATRRIWQEHWDMDVEGLLTLGLQTLLAANQELAEKGEPQFTLLDLASLYLSPTFRRRLVNEFVRDPLLAYAWTGLYERLYSEGRADLLDPFVSLLHISTGHSTTRLILGQSASTIDLRKIVSTRGILLVETNAYWLSRERGDLPEACLVEQLLSAIRERSANRSRARHDPLPIFVNGDDPLVYLDRPGWVEELKALGATLTVSTETLAQLDRGGEFSEELLASKPNLFVFSTAAEDARRLLPLLEDGSSPPQK